MSRTVSFVCSEKLAEWLEEEAEERMTTLSATAQQLLAEKYRESQEELASQLPKVMRENEDLWYEPDGKYNYAVNLPNGDIRYYKTADGAAGRIENEYGR